MGTSEESYRQLMEHFPEAVVVHDGKTILYANAEALRMGRAASEGELVGRPVLSFVSSRFHALVQNRIAEVTQKGSVTPLLREVFLRLDGTEMHVEVKTMPIEFGSIPAVQIVARDCTDRVKAEEALAASEAELRGLVREMPVGVVLHHRDGKAYQTNPKALELLGLSEDQILGHSAFDPGWNVVHDDETPYPVDQYPVSLAATQGRSVHGEVMGILHALRKERVWLSVDAVPQFGPDGAVDRVLVTLSDITEARTAQAKVRNLLHDKEIILKEVHHRIKNNMATVKGLLFLQAEAIKESPAHEVLRDAESRIQTMMALYDRLYLTEEFQAVSLPLYLPSLVQEILSCHPGSEALRVDVRSDDFTLSPEKLQPLGIILNELLTNILKYAFRGRAPGAVSVSATLSDGVATLTVADDGQGIPEGVDFNHSPGFGLSLVSMLARGLKAKTRLERGTGTRVVLEFPAL